ncbi:sigma-54 dependent transcriptional regulator [Paraburkholderia sp. MMS20-SJTR3]|uniref:Sigma-54 dependent transcriptional regulator n=1 Tax=Paraburkholderia sejongensis TaxID=2886946 RepID=A0ABS8K4C3_9BURK|nr:sigma-54 dependent transcriptional regulator [Paraburkholderia sp. MMS20-SJTR3]MCC8396825.1 sigma-54 dependent transcriptional regulator [Paraburkholderia sp. MMS20-SJTR3]
MLRSAQQRPLIYLTQIPQRGLCEQLKRRDWHVQVVADVGNIYAASGEVRGGVIDLSTVPTEALNEISAACAKLRDVAWVALVDSNQAQMPAVRSLLRDYCFDYITLPSADERIADSVGHAYGMASLSGQRFEKVPAVEKSMIGTCDAMLELFEAIRRVARTDAPVLVSGETGTGKELTAVAIHESSPRRAGAFVAINCAAIPHNLLQSELFGYERGAFTGANTRKIGHIEAADGGTLFLDEIGDLPLDSQASLLRFLQERTIRRLGGNDPVAVDCRIVSATHVDLLGAIPEGRFRADLFHRLCVLRVDQPPLRSRGKDIELLALHMFERFRSDAPHRVRGFAADAIDAMYKHDWPGNVRELINRVRRALVMAKGRLVTAEDLELQRNPEAAPLSIAAARQAIERETIELALARNRGRLAGVARELGVSRATVYRWMDAYGIPRPRNATAQTPDNG